MPQFSDGNFCFLILEILASNSPDWPSSPKLSVVFPSPPPPKINADLTPQFRPQTLFSTYSTVQYSLIILSLDAIHLSHLHDHYTNKHI